MAHACKVAGIFLLCLVSAAASEQKPEAADLVRIENAEVRLSPIGPIVLLKAQGKVIPIAVDAVVAESIQGALIGRKLPRPLSHDLMRGILEGFDGKVTRVVITLKGATYYADLTVSLRGTTKVFDSRSSDAIALATHFNAPIFVPRDLLDKQGVVEEPKKTKPEGTRL